jgi:hypothetical protein
MDSERKTHNNPTRTEYVLANLAGVSSPLEMRVAEKMARTRISELEKIVKGISAKWFKKGSDLEMIEQTQKEIGRIRDLLKEQKGKFGPV